MIAIITRTWNRPRYFAGCMASIERQSYKGKILHVVTDQTTGTRYTDGAIAGNYERIVLPVTINPKTDKRKDHPLITQGLYHAPWNLHMATALKYLTDIDLPGNTFVVYMDDDDQYLSPDALEIIAKAASSDPDFKLMGFWRVKFPHRLVPTDGNFRKPPVPGDISTLGFGHSLNLARFHQWDEWAYGDFRTADNMYRYADAAYYCDEVLTGLQRQKANGLGKGDDL